MTLRKLLLFTVMLSVLATGACGLGQNPARATLQASVTPDITPTFPSPPSATPDGATHTPEPSATPAATPTAGVTAEPTTPAESPTPGTALPVATGAAGENAAEFVSDVTVPDGTTFTPGEAFVKTWRVKNAGTATWGEGYVFAFATGAQMGGPASLPLPNSVAPGETVDISVDLTAPAALGSHTGFWQFRNAAGEPFGIGPDANQPVYVQINVGVAGNASPAPTTAPGASPAPTTAPSGGGFQVTSAVMSVDQTSIAGACPQSFVFSAALTSQGAGTMTYRVEAVSDSPGFAFNLPEANQSQFTGDGPRTFNASYTLEFAGSVSGQVWVHVLSPNDLESNRVSFSLTCQAAE